MTIRTRPLTAVIPDAAEAHAAEWNAAHPVGTAVRYWPGRRTDEPVTGVTTTAAWALGGHTAVVRIDTDTSCIALSHVEPTSPDTTKEN